MNVEVAQRVRRSDVYTRNIVILAAVGFLVLIAGVATTVYLLQGKRYVVELTEPQLQAQLDQIFPIEKSYLIFALRLFEPQVHLVEGADRVTFGVKAALNVRLEGEPKNLGGEGAITAGLEYNPKDYSFYLHDPRLERLEVQGIPVKHVEAVNALAERLARTRINRLPVYTLSRDDLKQVAARLVLKGLVVRDEKLVITLGL